MKRCARRGFAEKSTDEPAHQRADDAQNCGHEKAHMLRSGNKGPGNQANNESYDERPDDMYHALTINIPFRPVNYVAVLLSRNS